MPKEHEQNNNEKRTPSLEQIRMLLTVDAQQYEMLIQQAIEQGNHLSGVEIASLLTRTIRSQVREILAEMPLVTFAKKYYTNAILAELYATPQKDFSKDRRIISPEEAEGAYIGIYGIAPPHEQTLLTTPLVPLRSARFPQWHRVMIAKMEAPNSDGELNQIHDMVHIPRFRSALAAYIDERLDNQIKVN